MERANNYHRARAEFCDETAFGVNQLNLRVSQTSPEPAPTFFNSKHREPPRVTKTPESYKKMKSHDAMKKMKAAQTNEPATSSSAAPPASAVPPVATAPAAATTAAAATATTNYTALPRAGQGPNPYFSFKGNPKTGASLKTSVGCFLFFVFLSFIMTRWHHRPTSFGFLRFSQIPENRQFLMQ